MFIKEKMILEKGISMVRKMERKIPKPKFRTQEELNQFYMTHCFSCRKPLPENMVMQNKQIYRDNPEIGFMMHCEKCLRKMKK